jgi:hypothetical protein
MRVERETGRVSVVGAWYRLTMVPGGPVADLDDGAGRWCELRLLASVDRVECPDDTFDVVGPDIEEADGEVRLTWRLASSAWPAKRLVLAAGADTIGVHVEVEGGGDVSDVSLLAGRAVMARTTGTLMSGAWFETLFCASPTSPARIVKPASESAAIGVVSGSEHGRGNWFFTPGPFVYAASRSPVVDPTVIPDGPWLSFSLDAPAGAAGFNGFAYRAVDRGFGFALDYEGKTRVDRGGTWRSPQLVIGVATDPYAAIRLQRERLAAAGIATSSARRDKPAWWREPIFCGWGAQGALAREAGLPLGAAKGFATQADYDTFLDQLEARGIVPGTITIDDKWATAYGTCEVDTAKWPDLRSWIRRRRERGQRVLLWYKAWDPEGVPAEACVRSRTGAAIGLDPTSPAGEAAVRRAVRRMLAPDELDADGMKIDFTARTPSGVATAHHGPEWGVDLLRRLLEIVADEARRLKPDGLLVGHTPNALVAPFVDMIRLNDTLRLDDPSLPVDTVPQMRYRAAVVRAACPDHPIDTDDWCAPDLATWRAYTTAKADLGVPALYYASQLDLTGERFGDLDYELIRTTWAAYREAEGLPARGGD